MKPQYRNDRTRALAEARIKIEALIAAQDRAIAELVNPSTKAIAKAIRAGADMALGAVLELLEEEKAAAQSPRKAVRT